MIGELVIEILKKTDEVAYIRFASVYLEFSDMNASYVGTACRDL